MVTKERWLSIITMFLAISSVLISCGGGQQALRQSCDEIVSAIDKYNGDEVVNFVTPEEEISNLKFFAARLRKIETEDETLQAYIADYLTSAKKAIEALEVNARLDYDAGIAQMNRVNDKVADYCPNIESAGS